MNDSISNTLFRFVSLRSVQIPDPQSVDKKFAQIPESLVGKGIFYEAVTNKPPTMTKYQAMVQASEGFKEAITSVDQLAKNFGKMYSFSQWLAQNKTTASAEEIGSKARDIPKLTTSEAEQLWNNVFYQATTQQDGALKDRMSELLKANHLIERLGTGEENIPTLANAHLVIPAALFDEDFSESEPPKMLLDEKPTSIFPDRLMSQKVKVSEARLRMEQLDILQQDLSVLADEYQKQFQQAYDRAREQYDEEMAPKLEQYRQDVEEARKKHCSAFPGGQEKYNPDDPCQQIPYVPFPEIPKFDFPDKGELSDEIFRTRLDPVSYQTLMETIGYNKTTSSPMGRKSLAATTSSPQQLLDTIGSFSNLNSYVKNSVQLAQDTLTSNLSAYKPIKSIGGVLLPINNDINSDIFEYGACGTTTNLQCMATVFVRVPSSSWQISYINVVISRGNQSDSYRLDNPQMERSGNQITIHNIEGFAASDPNDTSKSMMSLDIVFTNGCVKHMPEVDIAAQMCWVGKLTGDCSDNAVVVPPLLPKKFGVRLLGIADYKKVEQTVHCYIEGEVSNIDNIMAREYREKSTRRLRRTEDTTTETSEKEAESFTDTITTDRFEMQTEIDAVIQQNKSNNAYVNTGYSGSGFHIEGGVAQASNISQEESVRRSVAEAKEITFQAQDRVVSKMKQERVQKIIDEFEENNKHGFDNRRGDKHVVGVYRWVDKLYKNQVYNYGKRMMFEFMVPEPGRLHVLAMKEEDESTTPTLKKPDDPRTSNNYRIATADQISEATARYWAAQYNADIPVKPDETIYISASFSDNGNSGSFVQDRNYVGGKDFSVDLPEGYKANWAEGVFHYVYIPSGIEAVSHGTLLIGNHWIGIGKSYEPNGNGVMFKDRPFSKYVGDVQEKLEISLIGGDVGGMSVTLRIKCLLTDEAKKSWQQECFQAIMDAYYEELKAYNEKVAAEENKAVEIKRTNPGFYRQIENTVLRKNCISYLIRDSQMGKSFTGGNKIDNFTVFRGKELDEYASMVKFMEQAFEWDLISYNFYPFYWADKGHWSDMYIYDESDDPVFRSFMQSGMARVIATVRPGFEEAVQLYMSTGKIWNGGDVPVIGDELYMSLIDEVRQAETVKEGKAWITRVPTSLTILQAKSAGLEVDKALPCNCDDLEDFEDPTQVPCSDSFVLNDNLIGGDTGPEPDPAE